MNIFKIKKLKRNSSYKKELTKDLYPLNKNDFFGKDFLEKEQFKIVTLEKDIIVYKKALKQRFYPCSPKNGLLVTLLIPKGTKVFITTYKCRAEKAIVLSIETIGFFKCYLKQAWSIYDSYFAYNLNDTIYPNFFEEGNRMCGHGIHFFLNKKEAKIY